MRYNWNNQTSLGQGFQIDWYNYKNLKETRWLPFAVGNVDHFMQNAIVHS